MQEVVSFVSLGSIYLLFALGLSIAWGTIDVLNFAHGSIFMFSAFTCYLVLGDVSLSLPLVMLIGIAVGAVLSMLVQAFAFEQIIARAPNRRAAEMQILIGGIGIAIVPLAIAQNYTKSNPFGFQASSFDVELYEFWGLRISNIQVITIVLALTLGIATAWWFRTSRLGLALRAIGVDKDVSSLMGINRRRMALGTMGFAGGLAGLAGVLLTYNLGAMTPEGGDTLLIKAFACIILGGIGSIAGVVVGSFALAATETLVLTQTTGQWVDAVAFGLIFVVLLVRPSGLLGTAAIRRT